MYGLHVLLDVQYFLYNIFTNKIQFLYTCVSTPYYFMQHTTHRSTSAPHPFCLLPHYAKTPRHFSHTALCHHTTVPGHHTITLHNYSPTPHCIIMTSPNYHIFSPHPTPIKSLYIQHLYNTALSLQTPHYNTRHTTTLHKPTAMRTTSLPPSLCSTPGQRTTASMTASLSRAGYSIIVIPPPPHRWTEELFPVPRITCLSPLKCSLLFLLTWKP